MSPPRLSAGVALGLVAWAFLAASATASARPREMTQPAGESQLQGAMLCSGTDPTGSDCPHRKKAVTLVPAFTKTTTTHHSTTPPHITNHTTQHPTNHTTAHPHHTTAHANHTTAHTDHSTAPTKHTTAHHSTAPTKHTTAHHTTARTHHTTAPTHHTTPHHTTAHPPHTTVGPRPTQPPFVPVGDYVVRSGSATCLRVQAGLQLRIRYASKAKQQLWGAFSVQPNHTRVSGNCSNDTATLGLRFPEGLLLFTFEKNTTQNTFYLGRVQANVTYRFPQATETAFAADNSSLRAFEAQSGHSYQCRKHTLELSEAFCVDALNERVQAFGLQGGQFGEAEVCPEQRRPPILPIVVGLVLLALIIVVIVAFVVGRLRSHRGYQTI